MRKHVLRWMALAMALMLLVGCGSNSAQPPAAQAGSSNSATESKPTTKQSLGSLDGGEIEIEFWHIQATIYGEAIKEIVAAFNQKHAGKIRVKEVFQGNYDDLNKKLRASMAGGGLPHVSMAYEADILEYMKADVVVPLDAYIQDSEWGLTPAELSDIMPGVLARQQIPQFGGKTMSWPHGNSSQGIYYNVELLQKAGYDRPTATWAEFVTQVRKIKESTGVPGLATGGSLGGSFMNWLRTYGVTAVASDGTISFDTPQAVTLLKHIKTMIDEGSAVIVQNTEQEFTNGRAAMEIGTTARTSSKVELIGERFPWQITLIPQGEGYSGAPSTQLYGGNQVMFTSNQNAQLASWVFLKYFAGPEAQAIYAAKTGYFPATKSSQETPLLKENYRQFPQKAQAFHEVFEHASIIPPSAALNTISRDVSAIISEVLANKIAPEDAVKKMQANATKIFKDLGQ